MSLSLYTPMYGAITMLTDLPIELATSFVQSTEIKKILLTRGKSTIVDAFDFEYLSQWKWYANDSSKGNRFYACRRPYIPNGGKVVTIRMHRLVLEYRGVDTSGLLVDHIDGDSLNNCFSNLRLTEAVGNSRNRAKNFNSSNKYKGVQPAGTKAWMAKIESSGKVDYLGTFGTPEEAALAYNNAAILLFGEFARLNELPKFVLKTFRKTCMICGKEIRRDAVRSYCVKHRHLNPEYRGIKCLSN